MAINVVTAAGGGSVALSNSVHARWTDAYEDSFYNTRLYDQLSSAPIGKPMSELARGSQVNFTFISHLEPGTSAISEVNDISPQALVDATASISPTSRGEAIQSSETLFLREAMGFPDKWPVLLGENSAESVDKLASDAALQGTMFKRAAVRSSLDAGTTGHRMSENVFVEAAAQIQDLRVPMFLDPDGALKESLLSIMSPMAYHDFRLEASSDIVTVGQQQQAGIILNWELARFGPFRLLVSPLSKIFYGAGAANGTSVATTLAAAVARLGTSLTVAASTNMEQVVGSDPAYLFVGITETGSTHLADNERVWLTGFTGSTGTIIGQGPNGGFRYAHESTNTVNRSDSVHPVIFGGPQSLQKIYAVEIGEFGQMVGPKKDGVLDQFVTLGYKWHGQYGRIAENRLLRLEVSTSEDA